MRTTSLLLAAVLLGGSFLLSPSHAAVVGPVCVGEACVPAYACVVDCAVAQACVPDAACALAMACWPEPECATVSACAAHDDAATCADACLVRDVACAQACAEAVGQDACADHEACIPLQGPLTLGASTRSQGCQPCLPPGCLPECGGTVPCLTPLFDVPFPATLAPCTTPSFTFRIDTGYNPSDGTVFTSGIDPMWTVSKQPVGGPGLASIHGHKPHAWWADASKAAWISAGATTWGVSGGYAYERPFQVYPNAYETYVVLKFAADDHVALEDEDGNPLTSGNGPDTLYSYHYPVEPGLHKIVAKVTNHANGPTGLLVEGYVTGKCRIVL